MASRMDEEREKQNSRVSVDYGRQHKTADRAAKQASARKTNAAPKKVSSGSTMRSNTESRTGEGKSLVGNYERQHKTVEKRPASSIRRSFTNYDSRNEFDPETLVGKSGRYWLAEISKIGENDREAGRELYSLYEQSKTDANSPLYDPYASATNTNPKYTQKNAAQTEKAKTEWQNLQKELSYWAQSDRNYSDEEILKRINWKNYPTLAKMDADRAGEGSTVYLNEPIGYDQDAMYGVMWAARNPDLATGDTTMDAVLGTLGRGNQYQRDEQKAARLDPASRDYNPYLVGSTMDSQLQTYGVNGFGSDWLDQNLQYRGTDDYTKVYKAEQTTKKAEQELSELKEQMDNLLDQGWTPEEVFTDDFLADYSTLQKLQNSIDNGSMIDTTRAIGYDRNAMQEAYQEAYTKRYGTKSNSEYAADTAAAMGASVQQNEAQAMVDDAGDKKQKGYYQPIIQSGTDAEKNSVKAGTGTAGYNRTVAQVEEGIQNGTAGAEGAAASKQLTVAQKTAPKFLELTAGINKTAKDAYSDELQAIIDKANVSAEEKDFENAVYDSLLEKSAGGDAEAAKMLEDWNDTYYNEYLSKKDKVASRQESEAELEKIKQQWQDAFGGDTPEYRSHVNAMEVISGFAEKPKTDWSAYDVVTLMSQQGVENIDQVTASARSLNQQKIDYIDQILERADQYGVPKNYLENMQATRDQLVRTNELIDSHGWKNNEDYAQAVEAFEASDMDTSYGAFTTGNEANTILLSVKDPEAAESALNAMKKTFTATGVLNQTLLYTTEMTEEERDNFKYLFASQGQENAMAYYDDLRPMLSARYAAEESETAQEIGKEHPVTGTAMSIMASLAQMEGSLYTAYMALTGQQADPNSQWFSANRFVGNVREGVKTDLDTLAGDNEFAKQAFRFIYDGVVSSADSLVSAYAGNAIGSVLPVLTAAQGASKGAQLIAKGSQVIAGNVGLTMMSTVAASNAMQEALLKGVDSDNAFYAGLASGVAEAVTEKIPFDKITEAYKAGSKGGKIMKLLADELIGEGIGEGLSEYLGAAGDYLVMGDDSDFIQSVNEYMENGDTEEEAIRKTVYELNQQALYATLAGAFSGVVSVGTANAAGRLASWYGRQEANQTVQEKHNRRSRMEDSNEQTEASTNTVQDQKTEGIQESFETVNQETETEISEQTELNQPEQAEPVVERSAEPDAQNETAENVPENDSEKREETGDRAVEEEKTAPSNSAEEMETSAETISKERTFDYDERLIIQDNRDFLAEQRNKVDQAQQNVEEARRALEELSREKSAAENELAMAEAAADPALMQEVERLRNDASEIRNERSKAYTRAQEAEDTYNRVNSDVSRHKLAERQLETAKAQIDSVTPSLNEAKTRLSRAEENLEQKQTSVPALKKEQNAALEEAGRKVSVEEYAVEAKRSALEEAQKSYNALQEEAEKRQAEYEELQREKKQLEEKRSSVYNERSEAQIRQDEDALERLIGESEQIQRSINENSTSIGRAERKVREAEKKAKAAKTNVDAATKELQVSEKAYSDAEAEQKKIAASIEALDKSLEDAKRVAERAKKDANQFQELVNGYNNAYQQAQKTVEGTNVSPDALEKAQAALDQRLEEVKSFETRQGDMERNLSEKEKALEETAAKKRDGRDKAIQLLNRYEQQRYELENAERELQREQQDYEMILDGLKRDYSAVDPEMYDAIIAETDPFEAKTSKVESEENALTALYTAQQNGVGEVQQTASVDAALRSFGMEPEISVAVSKRIVETESTEKATAILEAAPNRQKAAQAISMALLSPNSETAAVFADLNGQITAEDVNGLTQMYELDRLDDGAMGAYEAAIEESQLADDTMAVLSQMDNGRVESARENVTKAQQAADQSGAKLEAANAGLEAAQASLETARQRRNEKLNPETIAAESKALQQYGKAQEKQADAEAQYKADSKALEDAKGKVTAAQKEAVGQARSVALEQQKTRQEQKAVAKEQAILDSLPYKERFARELDAWDGQSKGKEFTVGHTSEVLLSLGVPDADINLLSDKVAKIKKDHPAMTDAVIKQIPDIVENPIVVMKSLTVPDRLTMFGEVTDANGAPVLAIIDTSLKANTKTGRVDVDIIRLNSAYGKDTHAQEFIDRSEILYVDKNRADDWSRSTRLNLPIGEDTISSANSIPQDAEAVNNSIADGKGNIPSGGNGNVAREMKESQFAVKTGQNTSVLTDETKQKLRESPYYQKVSQKGSVDRAINKVEKEGYEARKYRMLMGVTDILTPDGQTEAYVLSQIAKENGDTEGQAAIAFKVKESGTLLAQSLAMRSLYTEMTPEAKANYVQKLVDQINDQYESKGKDTRISVPDWLEQSLQNAGDNETKQSEALDRAYREIAAQMPYSATDTLNTWRFLSMLGNPMTHIKNVMANAAFMPYVAVKNRVAAGIEASVSQLQKLMGRETFERSKSFAPLKSEYRTFAKEICRQSEDILSGNEKANKANGKSKIDEYRRKAPALIDKLSHKNGDLLGAEDLMAKNHYFRYALASYLQANKADLTNLNDGMLERATQYAVDEAYKNTFNNVNQFAKWLSKTERELSVSRNPVAKAAGILLEGTVPFKNTPANIVSRGVEYSPAGLANAIFLNYRKLKSGTDYQGNAFTMQNYIDGIASGLTGTAAVAMGALLASCGVLDLGDDEDDEVREKNQNSVNVAGYNVGIDWSGVAAMPLLMGANLYERWSEKNGEPLSLSDFLNGVKSIADPVMDLSMVQGVTALLDTASYSDNALGTMGTKMATSYLGQFTPTVLGAITRTFFDDTRRTTYTDKNSDLSSETQYLLQSMRNKIPGLSKQGMAYLDAWGSEQQTDSLLERFLTNFVLPGYAKKIKTDDEVTEALLEMYDEYGDSGYLPTKAKKYFNVNGEKYNLSQEEYTKYAKDRGAIAHELLGALMQNESYQTAAPEFQLDAITDVWKYASQTAAYGINEGFKRDSWVASTRDPKETILEKMDVRIQTAEKDKLKASFFDAFDTGDVRSMKMCAAGLEEYGYQASSLRNACKTQYRTQYKELYENGDYDGMREMRDKLLAADIGFKGSDFSKWLEDEKRK